MTLALVLPPCSAPSTRGGSAETRLTGEVRVGGQHLGERATPDGPYGFDDGRVPVDGPEGRLGLVLEAALDELGRFFADEP